MTHVNKCKTVYKLILWSLVLFCWPFYALLGQEDLNIKNVSGFADSKHHWLDITDHDQVIVPLKDQQDYQPADFREIENVKLTVWCQQHDNVTLRPTGARTFELASKCSQESAEIVDFLMHVDNPNREITNAVNSAIAWFKEIAIKDIRVKTVAADSVVYQFHTSNNDRIVVNDPSAPLIWTRFYELETNRPMFANRDGKTVYQLSDVSRERRTGYAWYGYWPANIINVKFPLVLNLPNEAQAHKEDLAAENMLLWQRNNGGWPKDTYNILFDDSKTDTDNDINKNKTTAVKVLINYNIEQTPEQKKLALDSKHFIDATIDNTHTVREIRYLLQAFKKTANPKYSGGAQKGIDYLLKAQYANGGWPQFYPDRRTYRHDITFNDNAMANVMNLVMDISKGIENTDVLDKKYVPMAKAAFDKGVEIILKTQLELNGKKVVWCAQYDEVTLKPAKARAYELPSYSGSESVEIVRVLMRVDHPSAAIKESVAAAINWFEESKITGYKTQRIRDTTQPRGQDVIVVPDVSSVMWARFYDLETNKPFFCDRDGIKKNTLAEIGNERRAGYAWYGTWPLKLMSEEYPVWIKANP